MTASGTVATVRVILTTSESSRVALRGTLHEDSFRNNLPVVPMRPVCPVMQVAPVVPEAPAGEATVRQFFTIFGRMRSLLDGVRT